jgi:hypothetical protein
MLGSSYKKIRVHNAIDKILKNILNYKTLTFLIKYLPISLLSVSLLSVSLLSVALLSVALPLLLK